MRISTVIELLLILLLIAYAAYGRVVDRDEVHHRSVRAANSSKQSNMGLSTISLKQATDNVNRYCTCNENICNCCRDFHIPLVQLKGPGCASLQYLQGDNLAVQLSFGDNILTSTIVNGKSPKPVCVPLPGGFTKFCGRIYSIQRDAKNHFKACLGLELQSATELEASLRVSCFRFGPDGLKLRPAEPLPVVEAESSDEDDDDDFFGLGGDDDDDDDDDENDRPIGNAVPNSSATDDEDEEDDDDEDVLGLGALFDIITGGEESSTKKPKTTTAAPLLHFTIPILTRPSTVSPVEQHEPENLANNVAAEDLSENEGIEVTEEPSKLDEKENAESLETHDESDVDDASENMEEDESVDVTNKIALYAKPEKAPSNKLTGTEVSKKKPSLTSTSINAIAEDTKDKKKKPSKKPVKDEDDDDDDILGDDDLDDDDDEFLSDDDDDDDDDDDKDDEDEDDDDEKSDTEKHEDHEEEEEDENEKAEDVLDDDDDEEEDEMISALVYGEKEKVKRTKPKNKRTKQHAENEEDDDDSDYGLGLSGLLARNRHARTERRSKDMKV